MELSVFRDKYAVTTIDQLRLHMRHRYRSQYAAFWISYVKEGCPALGMFVNGESACMFYIREQGDPGFHSLGPDRQNFKDNMKFVIDNFQEDEYPLAMVVPLAQAVAAFEEFYQTRTLPNAIDWFEC